MKSVRANREQLPCWSYFLLGITLSMNFHYTGSDTLRQYYPTLLIGLSVVLWFIPFKICYHGSRMWLLNSLVSIQLEPRRRFA